MPMGRRSVHLDVGGFDDGCPLGKLVGEKFAEFARRADLDFRANFPKQPARARRREALAQCGVELVDNGRRRSRRSDDAEPEWRLQGGIADLDGRRHAGQFRAALRARNGQRTKLARLDMRETRGHHVRRRPSEPHLRPPRRAWARCRDRALQSSTAFYGVSWNSPQVPVPSRLVFTEAYGHILTSTHMFGTFPGHRTRTTDLSWPARSEIADWKAAVRDCACRSRRSPTPGRPSPAASGSYTGATPAQEAGSSKRPTGMGPHGPRRSRSRTTSRTLTVGTCFRTSRPRTSPGGWRAGGTIHPIPNP